MNQGPSQPSQQQQQQQQQRQQQQQQQQQQLRQQQQQQQQQQQFGFRPQGQSQIQNNVQPRSAPPNNNKSIIDMLMLNQMLQANRMNTLAFINAN